MKKNIYIPKWYIPIVVATIIGVLSGIFVYHMMKILGMGSYLQVDISASIAEANRSINQRHYFWYIVKIRTREVLLILFLAFTMFSKIYNFLYCVVFGFTHVVFLEALIAQKGISGIVYFIGNCFPHYFIYIPLLIFVFCVSDWVRSVTREKHWTMESKNIMKFLKIVVAVLCIILVEGLVEAWLNLFILRRI